MALQTKNNIGKIWIETQKKNAENIKAVVCTNYGAKTAKLSTQERQVGNSKQDLKNMS